MREPEQPIEGVKIVHPRQGEILIRMVCNTCKKSFGANVRELDFYEWKKNKKSVQDCFPYLNSDVRELFISKTCGACFDNLFGEK